MKLRGADGVSAFTVRLEFLKASVAKRRDLQPGTPVLVGNEEGKKVYVAPKDVRSYELAEATDAEREALLEYGFNWLLLG